jgi:hypothetical protein
VKNCHAVLGAVCGLHTGSRAPGPVCQTELARYMTSVGQRGERGAGVDRMSLGCSSTGISTLSQTPRTRHKHKTRALQPRRGGRDRFRAQNRSVARNDVRIADWEHGAVRLATIVLVLLRRGRDAASVGVPLKHSVDLQ